VLNLTARLVPDPTPPPTPYNPGLPPGAGLPTTPEDPPDPPALPPFTVNQLNVGRAIDNFFNNGGACRQHSCPSLG
jgi:hypothetical protein